MRSIQTLTAFLLTASLAACTVVTDDRDATLTIANQSSYYLDALHLAEVHSASWGPDLLLAPLAPGSQVTVLDIPCDTYDVLVVDETGVECQLASIDLCFDDQRWVVDDRTLDFCAFNKR
ncbi:MAG: hypothetical protein IPH44_34150 [Myxococcales bacterium]|nr:hypothetical protein [Myxococcales bacterium]MBK7192635.1 hypothetical protein [Myxococcales bacterium]MBP6847522.1 hypothetical protein [Kofleriaceae bacterium]